jgi:hypothetical protein
MSAEMQSTGRFHLDGSRSQEEPAEPKQDPVCGVAPLPKPLANLQRYFV